MRVKTGYARKRSHNRVLKRTKGMRMTKGKLYKVSKEADLHAGQYAFIGRKQKKSNFRTLWIKRLNAALTKHEISYSAFINKLSSAKIKLNRKMLSEIAIADPATFDEIVKQVK